MTAQSRRWFIDANNVMGSRPDGWWNDRTAAMLRLTQEVAEWCRGHDDEVMLVFDGPDVTEVRALGGGNLTVEFATRGGRNAADDRIVELSESSEPSRTIVVTADRGLIARVPTGAAIWGPQRLLQALHP